ncbi:MAG: type II toxin-antitoxin system RelE family toxin [Sporichthyaceae bacterium]
MPPKEQAEHGGPAEVWLTGPAVEDLRRLDGAPLVWALKKMLLLETDPLAGEPLVGPLVGYRKLVVGDRDWRIVWRSVVDERGTLTIEIAEVWAVGARADGEVYTEMERRVAALGDTPVRRSLEAVVGELGKAARTVQVRPVAVPPSAPEPWLVDRLVHTAGMDRAEVLTMTSEEAVDAWTAFVTRDGAIGLAGYARMRRGRGGRGGR